MASKKVQIQIDTRADTSGAKQAEDAVKKLSEEEKAAAKASKQAAREAAAAEKQAAREAAAAQKQAAKEAAEAVKAAAAEKKKALAQEKAAADAAAAASRRVGTTVTQAGFQVQDFAVQVAGGTSALTAMAQQAPQFLGVFGPGGAIAGALIAVGSIAAKVFLSMGDDAAKAKEEAEFLADAIDEIAKNSAKAVGEDIDFGLQRIADAGAKAESYIGILNRVKDAQEAASLSTAQNAETLRQAETEIARLTGKKIDEAKEIEAQLKAEAGIREQEAQNAIARRQRELEDAKAIEEQKENELYLTQRQLSQAEALVAKERERVAILEAQRREMELQVEQKPSAVGAFLSNDPDVSRRAFLGKRAEERLADPAFQQELKKARADLDVLEAEIQANTGKLTQAVRSITDELEKARADRSVIEQALAAEIPQIEQGLQTQQIISQIGGIKTIAEQAATEVQAVIETVKPANELEKHAIETLKLSAQDRQITADETLRVSQALGVLDSNIRKSMGDQLVNVNKLIQTISTLSGQLQQQQNQIDNLQRNLLRGAGR